MKLRFIYIILITLSCFHLLFIIKHFISPKIWDIYLYLLEYVNGKWLYIGKEEKKEGNILSTNADLMSDVWLNYSL